MVVEFRFRYIFVCFIVYRMVHLDFFLVGPIGRGLRTALEQSKSVSNQNGWPAHNRENVPDSLIENTLEVSLRQG